MRTPSLVAALAGGLLALGGASVADAAVPIIHAHRGGAIDEGVPVRPENTLPAFAHTAATYPDAWLELDSVVTKDGVPFVLHDSTLDRTTDCSGVVLDKTATQVEGCRVDILGAAGKTVPAPAGGPVVRVPRLADVLALAKREGRGVNVEIKRIPGDPGYVPFDESFATDVMRVVVAAHLDPAKLIVQSFDPTNLVTAKRLLPGVQTSYLTLAGSDPVGLPVAAALGIDWVSPGTVPDAGYMAQARALGLKVVPYTLDTVAQVQAAAAAGVDALITDDVPLARRALGLPLAAPTAPTAGPPTPPVLSATFPARTRRAALARGGLTVALDGPDARPARIRVTRGGTLVAAVSVRLRAGAGQRVRVPLTSAGRRVLRAARGPVRLSARVTSRGSAPIVRTITLR